MPPAPADFVLAFTGARDLTDFASLPATTINDAWYAYGSEKLNLDDDALLEYADDMTWRTLR